MTKLALVWLLTGSVLASCTFGGSSEDPRAGIDVLGPDASLDAGLAAGSAQPASDDPSSANSAPVRADAGQTTSVGAGVDASRPDATTPLAGTCQPALPTAVCDPVRNTGCPPLTQCDVDTAATSRSGRCVFPEAAPATGCTASIVSSSCTPQLTCVANDCRKLCNCDSDCGADACCSDTLDAGPAGAFKLCQPC